MTRNTLKIHEIALFLDFDGTLVDFAPSPEAVVVSKQLPDTLTKLAEQLGGAVAIVTGRHEASLQPLLTLNNVVHAYEHGSQIDYPKAIAPDAPTPVLSERDTQTIESVKNAITDFADQNQLISEIKKTSATLHYRQHPELETAVWAFIHSLTAQYPEFKVLRGKFVVELRFDDVDKGKAIAEIMQHQVFKGRKPLFIGDDVTDEHGFAVVNAMDGLSCKVGDGETSATLHLQDVAAVHEFLTSILTSQEVSW